LALARTPLELPDGHLEDPRPAVLVKRDLDLLAGPHERGSDVVPVGDRGSELTQALDLGLLMNRPVVGSLGKAAAIDRVDSRAAQLALDLD
jgi:hypothetical protein